MKNKILIATAALIIVVATASIIWGHTTSAADRNSAALKSQKTNLQLATSRQQTKDWLVSGPGRVEPYSEDIKLGAEMSGRLKSVFVEEGQPVQTGQVLAELVNDDYRAQIASAEAEVQQKEAELRKVFNGARLEERREAFSSVEEAKAVMANAESEMHRHQKLYEAGVISQEEADRFTKEYEVAKAQYQQKVQSHTLIDEETREEDRAMAQANLADAKAKLESARALYAKTFIRSPIDGTVLRKHHRTGENVSNGSTSPDPIFTLGDTHTLRVRIDVDETDVSKLVIGQKAYVTADAYGDRKFWGHVVRIGQELGRKNIRTDEPTERVDTKILETLIQLDSGEGLPVGLRVDSFILATDNPEVASK
jgi:ABC exporter DevB family membrane fusion protein